MSCASASCAGSPTTVGTVVFGFPLETVSVTTVSLATRSPGPGFWLITRFRAMVELGVRTTLVCRPSWWRMSSAFVRCDSSTLLTATGLFLSIAALTLW